MYNILMNKHYPIIANNMICETLDPKHKIAQQFNLQNTLYNIINH